MCEIDQLCAGVDDGSEVVKRKMVGVRRRDGVVVEIVGRRASSHPSTRVLRLPLSPSRPAVDVSGTDDALHDPQQHHSHHHHPPTRVRCFLFLLLLLRRPQRMAGSWAGVTTSASPPTLAQRRRRRCSLWRQRRIVLSGNGGSG